MTRLIPVSIVLIGMLAALSGRAMAGHAPSPVGDWLTGRGGAVVQIAPCADGNGLCGRIVGLVLNHGTPMPADYRGRPQCGFELIRPSVQHGRLWRGQIINPHNGHRYRAQFHVARSGELALRGYLGLPIFGETEHWMRYQGAVPPSCRIDQTQIASNTGNGLGRQN